MIYWDYIYIFIIGGKCVEEGHLSTMTDETLENVNVKIW